VEFVSFQPAHPASRANLTTFHTVFRLEHVNQNCHLYTKMRLPNWGFNQREVTCMTTSSQVSTRWRVVHNEHPGYNDTMPTTRFEALGMFGKILEHHTQAKRVDRPRDVCIKRARLMDWLTARGDRIHSSCREYAGARYTANRLVGVWMTFGVFIWLAMRVLSSVLEQAGVSVPAQVHTTLDASAWAILGWLVHLAPVFVAKDALRAYDGLDSFTFAVIVNVIVYAAADRPGQIAFASMLAVGVLVGTWM